MIPPVRIAVAVFVGLVVTAVLSIGTDIVMGVLGIFPRDGNIMTSQGLLLLASSYRAVFSILGAFVASLIARESCRPAVLILGGIAMFMGLIGMLVMWDKWTGATAWYPISLAVLAIPYCWIGGRLSARYQSLKS